MAHYFVICETGDKKFIKRVYDTIDECRDYFESLHREAQSKAESYQVLSHSDTELTIEEIGTGSRRKYTCLTGEMDDVVRLIQEPKNEDPSGPL
jgi:hypothetical protein